MGITAPLTAKLRTKPPGIHAGGKRYLGLEWSALAWLEQTVKPEMTTLETGSGGSTLIFAGANSKHTAISPDAQEHVNIRDWCQANGLSADQIAFIAEPSHLALTANWTPEALDLVLLDGAHGFPFPTLDWYYTAIHLRIGGWMVIDDAFLPSVNGLVTYLKLSREWEMNALGYRTVAFKKLGDEISMDWVGSRFDRHPRFNYLSPLPRLVAWLRHRLIDRSRLGQRLILRLGRG